MAGLAGQRPPRGGALTPGLDQWHGAFPGVAVETEGLGNNSQMVLCSAMGHLLLRHLPIEWGLLGPPGSLCATEPKGDSLVPSEEESPQQVAGQGS